MRMSYVSAVMRPFDVLGTVLVLIFYFASPSLANAERSRITLPVSVSMEDVREQLNSAIPEVLVNNPAQRQICVPAKYVSTKIPEFRGIRIYSKTVSTKISPDISCDVSSHVSRVGPVQLRAEGNSLVGTVILNGQATVRGRGTVGENIRETASGTLRIDVRITPTLGVNWMFSGDPQISHHWVQRPKAKLFNLFDITFTGEADRKLDEMRGKMISQINARLQALPVRSEVATQWRRIQKPIELWPEQRLFLSVRPRSVGLSVLTATDDKLAMTFMLEADTVVSIGKPNERPVIELPNLRRLSEITPRFRMQFPMVAEYGEFDRQLAELLELPRELDVQSPFGTMSKLKIGKPRTRGIDDFQMMIVLDAVIIASDGASVPLSLHLVAKPKIDQVTHLLSITLPSSTLKVGSSRQPSILFDLLFRKLASRIEHEFSYDFAKDWHLLEKQLSNMKTTKLQTGVTLKTQFETPTHGKLMIGNAAISLVASVSGTAELLVSR